MFHISNGFPKLVIFVFFILLCERAAAVLHAPPGLVARARGVLGRGASPVCRGPGRSPTMQVGSSIYYRLAKAGILCSGVSHRVSHDF